jgi:hypothetical protein
MKEGQPHKGPVKPQGSSCNSNSSSGSSSYSHVRTQITTGQDEMVHKQKKSLAGTSTVLAKEKKHRTAVVPSKKKKSSPTDRSDPRL